MNISFFKNASDSDRQGGPPHLNICLKITKKHCNYQKLSKKEQVTLIAFTICWSFVPQPISRFWRHNQCIRMLEYISVAPPFPLFLSFFHNSHWSFWCFQLPHLFLTLLHLLRLLFIYSRTHFLLVFVSGGSKAARMASSNTFFSPRWLTMRQNKSEIKKCSFIVVCFNNLTAFSLKLCENLTLTCVKAEHSTYFTALSSRTSFSPLSGYRGRCLFFASFSIVLLSSRRSTCVPTNKKGVRGQWWEISGTHWGKKKKD